MCRKQKNCVELGTDPNLWNRRAPLPVPDWFHDELIKFVAAVSEAANGKVSESIRLLGEVRDSDLRQWYVEHGQLSGMYRANYFDLAVPKSPEVPLDPIRSPDRHAKEVLSRDGYRCRYCGLRVVPKNVLAAYSEAVGSEVFRVTGTNAQRHGVVLAFRANVDHVVPWNLGGRTVPENLVTACWACNYGKSGYTLEQIGLEDPRAYPPEVDNWDGLTSLRVPLRAVTRAESA
ncbi:5-methylcytosine-specific restriction endonuclease McrA [Marinobacterium halophilum]|uniref:5-methylcytosine-specific restriction endonuclease McrA n=2 Tax=Marinobacterium halophilum TaxID=267374 RepID=A0A2P8F4Z4_9GAMM|nr:5-methylcytosine-specific restriction endonuclease McrA [Marinobacterium halophilum]